MPVTFCPAPHNKLEPVNHPPKSLTGDSIVSILNELRPKSREIPDQVLQSSFLPRDALRTDGGPLPSPSPFASGVGVNTSDAFRPAKNGLVDTVLSAYGQHHALVLRPDDVWMGILTQFSLFLNGSGRAEELRPKFVTHEGKKKLIINVFDIHYSTTDYAPLALQFTNLIQKNVVDPTLQEWILPNFTTTTTTDVVAASVVMMATFQAYFEYEMLCVCGIPRVTLLGEQADWQNILMRAEKLKEYGPEAKAWYRMLQPVLRRFVRAFDQGFADSQENIEFWQRVAHRSGNCAEGMRLDGWITAFCAFDDENGRWLGGSLDLCDMDPIPGDIAFNDPDVRSRAYSNAYGVSPFGRIPGLFKSRHNKASPDERKSTLVIDGVSYHSISPFRIPGGYAEAPVTVHNNGEAINCAMVAGLVGTAVSDSGAESSSVGAGKQDQVRPVTGWWMFTLKKGITRAHERVDIFGFPFARAS